MTTQERPDIDVNKKGVELDANGNPYYKWPPFPDPPENVKIMPFSEFKASGIQISFDDEAEVDGLGIPTVRLPIIHNNEAPPRKKKKTKMTPAGEEIRQRNVWWEEWEEGEEQRAIGIGTYDRNLYARDRVAQAVVDFRRMHDWQAPHLRLLDWYKKLEVYLGLHEPNLRPRLPRKKDRDEEHEEDVDMDDDDTLGNQQNAPISLKVEKFDEEKHKLKNDTASDLTSEQEERFRQKLARVKEALEIRLEAFVDDPCLATKVFFCSYFRDSGMMWEKMALRDAPRIYEFFLMFLIRTRALYEEETGLKRALEITRKAKEELPLTMQIGQSMPDELARCLTAIFGSKMRGFSWENEPSTVAADPEFKPQVEESGGTIVSDWGAAPPNNPPHNDTSGSDPNQLSSSEDTTGGWGSIGADAVNWGTSATSDQQIGTNDDDDDNPWGQNSTQKSFDAWGVPDIHFLMTLLGPTTLPLTHTTGYVEESTRYIGSVIFPEADESLSKESSTSNDPLKAFARVVLNPYSSFAAPSAPRAAIQPPSVLEDPWKGTPAGRDSKPAIPKHDPKEDPITILVDPEVGKLLASGKHMGLGGTFVQVVPIQPAEGQSDADRATEESTFWYAEKTMQVLTSFWTERQI